MPAHNTTQQEKLMASHEVNLKLSTFQVVILSLGLGVALGIPTGITAYEYGWSKGASGDHSEVKPMVARESDASGITGFTSSQVREYAGRLMWIADIKAACEKAGIGNVEVTTFESAEFYKKSCAIPDVPPKV
jgi:hypothetical protein